MRAFGHYFAQFAISGLERCRVPRVCGRRPDPPRRPLACTFREEPGSARNRAMFTANAHQIAAPRRDAPLLEAVNASRPPNYIFFDGPLRQHLSLSRPTASLHHRHHRPDRRRTASATGSTMTHWTPAGLRWAGPRVMTSSPAPLPASPVAPLAGEGGRGGT